MMMLVCIHACMCMYVCTYAWTNRSAIASPTLGVPGSQVCNPLYLHPYMHTYLTYIPYIHTYIHTYLIHTYIDTLYIHTYIHVYLTYIHPDIHTYIPTYIQGATPETALAMVTWIQEMAQDVIAQVGR